ncbi:unnamed protein product [Rhizophagus irregularis]|nr:unnamed protein product [Rhizophagus irregularis]
MAKGKTHQNNGPYIVYGLQNSEETFRKLTENILAKAIKSPAAQQLTFNLNLNDQLYQLHYNNFVAYDRGIIKLKKKRKNTDDLSYYPEGSKQRKVSLTQETYDELIQQIEDLEFQLNQMEKAKKSVSLESNEFSEFFSDKIGQITNILYRHFQEKNLPVWNATEFKKLIESKNLQTQQLLKQKVMLLCYQIAAMHNKQVSGTKTAIGTRIPSVTSKDQISHMATILFNTNEAPPIPYYTNTYLPIHNPNGVDAFIIKTALWNTHLIPLAKSYNSIKSY